MKILDQVNVTAWHRTKKDGR